MTVTVIYHGGRCSDGFTAAWAAWRRLEDEKDGWKETVNYVPAIYGQTIDVEALRGERVIILDYFPRDQIKDICDAAENVLVLDHHKTAYEEAKTMTWAHMAPIQPKFRTWLTGVLPRYTFYFDMKRSGAGIAWDFFFPDQPRPDFVNFVEDRDLWKFEMSMSREHDAFLRPQPQNFDNWEDIAFRKRRITDIMADGGSVLRYEQFLVDDICSKAEPATLLGHQCIAVNCPGLYSSDVGNRLLELHPTMPFALTYRITNEFRASLRARKDSDVDVAAICEKLEGGGHKSAAGFRCPVSRIVTDQRISIAGF